MINKMSTSSMSSKVWYRSMLAGNDAYIPSSFDLISTTTLSSSTSSITFDVTGLGSTYKHLQIRGAIQGAHNGSGYLQARLNGATTSYTAHQLAGEGSVVYSYVPGSTSYMQLGTLFGYNNSVPGHGGVVLDLLDAFSTDKNKTIKAFGGWVRSDVSSREVFLGSGAWFSTSAITSVTISSSSGNLNTGTRLSIYGIKGA